jgi:hypothetical protein
VGLERDPLSPVSKIEELLKEKVAAPDWKTENTALEIRHADYTTPFYPQKLALTSPTSDGRLVGIVRSRTKPTELILFI